MKVNISSANTESEIKEKEPKIKTKKSSILIKRDIFRVLAVLMLVASVVCGIVFANTKVRATTMYLTTIEKNVFEWWRVVLFSFVGLFGSGCFLGISAVFNELEKLRVKKNK